MMSTEVNNVDHRAPDVRHLVYSMYRKMLTGYNDQANEIVDALPRDVVQEDADIYKHLEEVIKQQSTTPAGDGAPAGGAVPPPPPSLPGTLPGRRLKTEIPERSLEPPAAIQNAMMTKDKKPFTYTPGGIDLSEIRSPKMARRINRNACADEMPGIPAPTTGVPPPAPSTNTHFAAMQSQLPAQVLPPVGGPAPPPPPPPPPGPGSVTPAAPPQPSPTASSNTLPRPNAGRPPLGFDPNELLARVNKTPAYEPVAEPPRNFKPQPVEEKPVFEPKQKSNEIGQNIYVPLQNEPGHIYVPQVPQKVQAEPVYPPPAATSNRGQLGSLYVPPVTNVTQEQSTPSPTSPYGYKPQQSSPSSSMTSPNVETKPSAPWVTVYRTPQPSVPWANREPETPKPSGGTRIIPIQIEGRDSPKPSTPTPQPQVTPPPFLQQRQQPQQQHSPQKQHQPQQQVQHQPQSNMRVIPIQIEGATTNQPRTPGQTFNQNKFNPMTPQSPTPYSPSQEKEQKPQWAPVQPRPFKKEESVVQQQRPQQTNDTGRMQQMPPQPEYGTYNTAGVPISQLRKMQLSDDDRALMDKFKSQVERHGNDILSDENCNPRYRGGYIPSRVFKMLDESGKVIHILNKGVKTYKKVDDEVYLHRESDPRYRGAVIPSRAFRMLQSMTDTAGDMQQQVPRSPSRGPTSRPVSAQFQQEAPPSGPYVPPSEQQVQEPRKYTGGSIPSRSFRMLQAMTGQEVSAPNPMCSPSGRETPVSGLNRWCPSPSPSPIDPFWGYYPPDPYFVYNYISDLNAAYGFPPPPIPPPVYTPPPFPPSYYQMYQNYSSDTDEQGYSSTDELAQYCANYRRNFGYSPYQPNPERYYASTPNSFNPPIGGKKSEQIQKKVGKQNGEIEKETKPSEPKPREERIIKVEAEDNESISSTDEDSETETEEDGVEHTGSCKVSSLQTLKSVSNVNIYQSESSSTVVQDDFHVEEMEHEEDVEEEEEEISSSESQVESEPKEPMPHQLSVIFEESEHSDVENNRRLEHIRGRGTSLISESESCSTLDNGEEDDSDNDDVDAESSVTVRLPLKLKFSRTDNDEDITTVIVGDSQVQRETLYNLKDTKKVVAVEEEGEEDSYQSDNGDISVTFTVPTRSNSVISVEQVDKKEEKEDIVHEIIEDEKEIDKKQPEVDTEVTVCVSLSRKTVNEEDKVREQEDEQKMKIPVFESKADVEDDSSSTSAQSGDTVLKHKGDTDEESEEEEKEGVKPVVDSLKTWLEKDCKKNVETDEEDVEEEEEKEEEGEVRVDDNSYRAGVGKLEEMISSLLETTKDTMNSSVELSQKDKPATGLRKKDSQEESEEDDSGVTSDVSIKQMNSETDADTESDYSELSKMTKFQRASTHSRLFKLLQDECERCEQEIEVGETSLKETQQDEQKKRPEDEAISLRKKKLTLPLNQIEVESLSSSSGIASPSSPTISDRLVKELIHSLLNKKKGKKFRKLPVAKLHAAALKILQEEMDPYDTSPTSGDDGMFLSPIQKKQLHSKLTAKFRDPEKEVQYLEPVPETIYGDNYYDYLEYYNTWGNPEMYYPEEYDIVPSRAFRMLREQTCSPKPIEGFKARCPRVSSKKNLPETETVRKTPAIVTHDVDSGYEWTSFSDKQEKVAKVLEKSRKS